MFRLRYLLLFLILFSLVSASDYIFYDNFEELGEVDSPVEDCREYNKSEHYLGYSLEAMGCVDEQYCVLEYSYPSCDSDGDWEQDLVLENCEDCKFGCYLGGCLNEEVSCDDLESCRVGRGEVLKVGDVRIAVLGFYADPYLFLEGTMTSSGYMDNWQQVGSHKKLKDDYFVHFSKRTDEYVEFSIKIEENECAEDGDCEGGRFVNCGDGFLQTVVKKGVCDGGKKCDMEIVDVIEESCEYKCENKTCVECDGCLVDGECLMEGFEDNSSYCEGGDYVLKSGYEGICLIDRDCFEGICKKGICSKEGFFSGFFDWFKELFLILFSFR